MSAYEQEFLQNITNIRGVDFETWQGWEQLMAWTKRQPWKQEFFGGDKIPSRLLHPATLVTELTKYLGG